MTPAEDAHCLAQLRHYRSLMPLAQEARKPIFRLKPADGALGSHYEAARQVYREFRGLAEAILTGTGLTVRERSLPGEA